GSVRPTNRCDRGAAIPPTEVGGWFKSGLQTGVTEGLKFHPRKLVGFKNPVGAVRRWDLNHPPTAVGGIVGFSHNLFRWWDSRTRFVLACRLDLNNPPTPVGGISEFSFSCALIGVNN